MKNTMNYSTKEFLIQLESTNRKNFAEGIKNNNRALSYCRLRLGDDMESRAAGGAPAVEALICPDCGQVRDCFITEKFFSRDGRKRVIKASCMVCEGIFYAYQEEEE